MPVFTEGVWSINFGIVKLSGKLTEQDRQCAWELYTEIITRSAVSGKRREVDCSDFTGEIYIESLASLYSFFQEARSIMKKYPVGRLSVNDQHHLGILIHDLLTDVLRPFLERWQADLRSWWASQQSSKESWFERQKKYPNQSELIQEWADLRRLMRQIEVALREEYQLQSTGS